MEEVTIGPKYQIVIPKSIRKKMKGIIPGHKVRVHYSPVDQSVKVQTVQDNWIDRNYGLMKEAWKDIDPIAELEKMRNEGEEQSRALQEELKNALSRDRH